MTGRIVVVRNPTSTRAADVQRDVIDGLSSQGIAFTEHRTSYADTEANITDMRLAFRDGDTILSAAGDATAMQIANAVLRERHADTRIGFLGYGNFNDLSRKQRDPLELLAPTAHTVETHPLTIALNDEYWRDAPGYMTLGFTALAANEFDSYDSRRRLRRAPKLTKALASIAQLGTSYFEYRSAKLPAFHTSESPLVRHAVSDFLAINSRQVGGIMKSATDYATTDYFGYHFADVSGVIKNLPFGLLALAGRMPATSARHFEIIFEQPSQVPIQTEGEFALVDDVEKISVFKDPTKTLKIIRK